MNLKKRVNQLERENVKLKLQVLKLQLDLEHMIDLKDWKHPRSCLHNSDPWPDL